MLELIDMPGSNGLLPAELSGGMQKRAGLARAIILEPKVILFDEPTAGLDPVNTKRLISNIQRLKERGMTGIFVSHDIPTVKEIADRVAILHKGRIPIVGTVAELQNSKDPLVQSFLADTHVEKPAKA
jgi:phospholipid/cholesterol/gamma-HCH transport system ATP-binding protein